MINRRGFTLIEVIVSLAILGIVAVSMLSVFDTGLRNIIRAGARTEAVYEAEDNLVIDYTIMGYEELTITLPTPDGNESIVVKGSHIKGESLNASGFIPVEVEIKTYIPGILDSE